MKRGQIRRGAPLGPRPALDRRWQLLVCCALACSSLLLFLAVAPEGAQAQAKPNADVVFLLDESGSTSPIQAPIKARVNEIASTLATQVNPRLALVGFGSSQAHAQGLRPGAQEGDAHTHTDFTDAAGFTNALTGLTDDGFLEYGLTATTFAMTGLQGFRPNAGTCAVLITDEGGDVKTSEASELAAAVAALKQRNAVFFGVTPTGDPDSQRRYGPNPGSLAASSGGAVFDIQSFISDAGPVLQAVLAQCAKVVQQRFDTKDPEISIRGVLGRGRCTTSNSFRARIKISDQSRLDNAVVRVDGKVVRRTTSRQAFRVTLRPRAGRHRISVVARDVAGNRASRVVRFTRCRPRLSLTG